MSDKLPEMAGDALFSTDRHYRYLLQRFWNVKLQTVNFIMLNPSTADASVNDATIRRCIGFALRLGFGSLEVTNLFAWRSTDPRAMKKTFDPIGPENDEHIASSAKVCNLTICAWGQHGKFKGRDQLVLGMLRGAGVTPHVLALAKDGTPKHPLYLSSDCFPVPLP